MSRKRTLLRYRRVQCLILWLEDPFIVIYSESQSPGVLVTRPKSFTFRPSLVRYLEMIPGIEAQEGRKENNLNDDNVIRTLSADGR
jgi:hypothetical protein